ncbi:MAG: hypothetical protein K6G58_01615 [Lachnospiraceae bacterium]|nr:hypothetical protein [Lachnospiraceae bacterium]
MDNKGSYTKILESSNISSVRGMSDFVRTYIEKLVYDISMYVDPDFTLGKIEILNGYTGRCELSQAIIGVPSAYSCIEGRESVLAQFARNYSHLEIGSFDVLAREAVLDFLNLHNGLFVVLLSKNNICELSLDAPKRNGNFTIDMSLYSSITVIPVTFPYGTVKFFLCENR